MEKKYEKLEGMANFEHLRWASAFDQGFFLPFGPKEGMFCPFLVFIINIGNF